MMLWSQTTGPVTDSIVRAGPADHHAAAAKGDNRGAWHDRRAEPGRDHSSTEEARAEAHRPSTLRRLCRWPLSRRRKPYRWSASCCCRGWRSGGAGNALRLPTP